MEVKTRASLSLSNTGHLQAWPAISLQLGMMTAPMPWLEVKTSCRIWSLYAEALAGLIDVSVLDIDHEQGPYPSPLW